MAMNKDYEPISARSGKGLGIRPLIFLALIAFIGGGIATGWAMSRFNLLGSETEATTTSTSEAEAQVSEPVRQLDQRIQADGTVQPTPPPAAANDNALANDPSLVGTGLSRRVAELEDRLSRINVQAQAASGNAARAEGLLIAFAARRALDTGSPLGYIEEQLKLRFGAAQPNAVATIIEAARKPVTMDALRTGLAEISPSSTGARPDESWWAAFRRETSELFVLRRQGSPSPAPEQRLERAATYLESERVAEALAEVQKLPNQEPVEDWVDLAKRYTTARQALDFIETAAILEPRELRTGEGERVEQPSPLAAEGETGQQSSR
ncbi:hypothetical protein [Alterisphingorhabdus coralli]|uniref:Inner membrane protein n=1 Tax=Alterisphingorhabdus coralli TaxID=3071408 RepID=A0AA97F7D1_9SPHN|nr:hypothetical protein [Parasphingorhabdus sp. SCSIO 66989]WOE75328.1 hypothetical protein RB602_01025 [Parasphingorhabdus sp. SCSIO 66989]